MSIQVALEAVHYKLLVKTVTSLAQPLGRVGPVVPHAKLASVSRLDLLRYVRCSNSTPIRLGKNGDEKY